MVAAPAPGDPYVAPPPMRPFVDEVGADPGRLRVMYAPGPPFPGTVDARVAAVADMAARTLEDLGHGVQRAAPALDPEVVRRSVTVIHGAANAVIFQRVVHSLGREPEPGELDPVTWDMVREGQRLTAADHLSAINDLHAQTRRAAAAFATADVLLCPTLNTLPPAPGLLSAPRGTVDAFFDVEFATTGWTVVANVTGWAAISLPLGEADGLPVGVQLMAPDEAVLLRVAAQLEQALPWAARRPPAYS